MVRGQTILSTLKLAAIGAVIGLQWVVLVVPAFATETIISPLKITEIYPDAPGATASVELTQEYIELANFSATSVDLSTYQLQVKNHMTKKMYLSGELAPYHYQAFVTPFSLLNGGDTLQLVLLSPGGEEIIIEEISYAKTAGDAWSWSYFPEGWEQTPLTPNAPSQREIEEPEPEDPPDICPLTPEIDTIVPKGYHLNESGECVEDLPVPTLSCKIVITEISAQPNLAGKEYIEFFNPTNTDILLQLCTVQINGKPAKVLPEVLIPPHGYHVWELGSGTVSNGGGVVRLQQSDNTEREYSYKETAAGQVVNYDAGQVIGIVSDIPTPGAANEFGTIDEEGGKGAGTVAVPADCGPGRYRSPETNRCRTIETATNVLTPCASDQERNPETNRCRKITTAASTLTPCKAGQERNPETNRCRQIAVAGNTLKPCAEGQERNPQTNRCRKIASTANLGSSLSAGSEQGASNPAAGYTVPIITSIAVACIGYGIYEYRFELQNIAQKIKWLPRRSRPPD